MKTEDVQHLARLARIAINDAEATQLTIEIEAILAYVSEVQAVAGTETIEPAVGPVHNVFRDDVITNEPEQYTEIVLKAMPETSGRYLKVKKILSQDD